MSHQQTSIYEDIQVIPENPTSAAVGFTAMWHFDERQEQKALSTLGRALQHFQNLDRLSIECGNSRLEIWGRGNLSDCFRYLSDGSIIINVGSPLSESSWWELNESISNRTSSGVVLYGGRRYVHLWVSPDGNCWRLSNDWLGSIPVFYSQTKSGRIASTLEPVVVAGGGLSADDIYTPSLLSLLIHGHYLGDWTLFKGMKVVPPDCLTEWVDQDIHFKRLFSVQGSDSRWQSGWDELIDEMYTFSRRAIEKTLQTRPRWILPLSGGLDSRLIASVAVESGVACHAYTWGTPDTTDVKYARQVAKKLGLPWKRIDPGVDYLCDYNQLWADLFGSAMHFHGMYQIPFFNSLSSDYALPSISGYLGDALSGYGTRFRCELHNNNETLYQTHPDGYLHWLVKDIPKLLRIPIEEGLDQIAEEINRLLDIPIGALFQRQSLSAFWGRQRHFTYFNSMLSDYWLGVDTPYLDREYANFCMSLPRCVLDDRRLLVEMLKRYYGRVAVVRDTYNSEPMYYSVRYILRRRIAQLLNRTPLRGSLKLDSRRRPTSDIDNVSNAGWNAFWPIQETKERLDEWLNTELLDEVYEQASCGSMNAVRKLQSIQTLAYRLLEA